MNHRTIVLSSFEQYLGKCDFSSIEVKTEIIKERELLTNQFPYPVMLEMAYAELDLAHRWCWDKFGEMDGLCLQKYSEYKVCFSESPHRHIGKWTSHWFEKTDYDFGFNEFYFKNQADQKSFIAKLPELNWGENYPV